MATTFAPSLPLSPPPPQRSPSLKGIKKVLSSQRRPSEAQSDVSTGSIPRSSTDSLLLEKSPSLKSSGSPSRDDGSTRFSSVRVRKLVPGHAKRQRRKLRDEELKAAAEEVLRGRQPESGTMVLPTILNRSQSSLMTDESDLESPPPLTSRESHAGYLTTSSPLFKSATIDSAGDAQKQNARAHMLNSSTEQFPTIVEPVPELPSSPTNLPSPLPPPVIASSPINPSPGLIDKADTLLPGPRADRSSSFSRLRGKSPVRKFKDTFSKSSRSARTSPERTSDPAGPGPESTELFRASTGMGNRRSAQNPEARTPSPLRAQTLPVLDVSPPKSAMPAMTTDLEPPKTPPSAIKETIVTTVTPPTPTDSPHGSPITSPRLEEEGTSSTDESSGIVVSQGGNMISHRRVRSSPGITHQKSKLSTSMTVPLTPTIEEVKPATPSEKSAGGRNITPGGGFFSSWVSAAQNAANTITNLTNQNRSRSGTNASDPAKPYGLDDTDKNESQPTEIESPKKQLAVETMGSGNLDFSHLGIDNGVDKTIPATAPSEGISRRPVGGLQKEEAAAKIEDMLAKRAVSQAYEKPINSGEGTPIAEVPDPVASIKPSQTFDTSGALTPPNGSIFEGETGPIKRSNSVRSKLQNRRSRGSSINTGQSAISAMVGASTAALANPATGPRLSGFAIAPKQRNRAFHQQFRSVPEDDYLIEDYSCALQKEILLAGRLYISEGHICFSSNILGWVTTLIISFEEVVSIEKENTAIVIPNAIAVQTLHARHTLRSLLSREATFDLMVGIWRVSHPDSFSKSINSKQLAAEAGKVEDVATTKGIEEADVQDSEEGSDDGSEDGDEEDGDDSAPSIIGSSGSTVGSEMVESKPVNRKVSTPTGINGTSTGAATTLPAADATAAVTPVVGAAESSVDFPGPATHAATECADKATHYDKILKDEVIAAPLGKIYSLLYGPQSGIFVRKFLEDGISKAQDLQMEDDKKGLNNETKSRQYRYIKPLGGGIGPKQTNCITTENLDFFDLDKAVSVTCSTQTPDVPSGNAFNVKTRYCLTWAPGNATRLQMNMTIEWTAKSWLKGPIESGALGGQTQYGDDLVKTLKAAVGRTRATTTTSSRAGKLKKKRKGGKKEKTEEARAETKHEVNWGIFEPARPVLGPAVEIIQPFARMEVVVGILTFMVLWMWMRGGSSSRQVSFPFSHPSERMVAYEQLWQQEESDLWDWLEERVGVDRAIVRDRLEFSPPGERKTERQRQKRLKNKDAAIRLREQKTSLKEMQEAVRVTRDRLEAVQESLDRQRSRA